MGLQIDFSLVAYWQQSDRLQYGNKAFIQASFSQRKWIRRIDIALKPARPSVLIIFFGLVWSSALIASCGALMILCSSQVGCGDPTQSLGTPLEA